MNIFALDPDPVQAARWHVDKHVVNMPRETAQMLCTVLRASLDTKQLADVERSLGVPLHKTTHANHPCTVWVGENISNWLWLKALGLALLDEHQHRYGTNRSDYRGFIASLPIPPLAKRARTPFALAMPEWIKEAGLPPCTAYKVFYTNHKTHLFSWKRRKAPAWISYEMLPYHDRFRRALGIGPYLLAT